MSNTIERISTLTCNDGASTECLTYLNVRIDKDFTYTNYECAVSGGPAYLYYDATSTPGSSVTSVSPTPVSTSTISSITPSPTTSSPAPSPKNPTPVGAIVGGVLGGIAALALIGFGTFFLMRRKRTAVSGPMPYDQSVYTAGQSRPTLTVVPETTQYPNPVPTASQTVDTKGVVPVANPSSPTPPYQPPCSSTQKTVDAHEAHLAQLP
ncbi:hypothetical protein yc1106_05571 [Curvularia clavata]|uniref:Uncharacterized protein n=1 Tax=Curvularia clavata TaxID=95742 RepID=A0A9Q8Z8B6_CURCL|nr:hypothetical protein yc1106_05571 [Curvularia clavata]